MSLSPRKSQEKEKMFNPLVYHRGDQQSCVSFILWSFQHSAYAALSLLRRDYLNNRYPRFIMPFGLKVEPHLFLLAYIYVKFGAIPLFSTFEQTLIEVFVYRVYVLS